MNISNRKKCKRGGIERIVWIVLIALLISINLSWGFEVVHNILPTRISMDYGQTRRFPIFFSDEGASKYTYIIRISSSKLKVYLVDKNNVPLPSPFSSQDLETGNLIIGNNEIYKVKTAYILFKYHTPSRGEKVKVDVDITPHYSDFSGNYTSRISSSIHYSFTVYLNPPLPPPSGGGYSGSGNSGGMEEEQQNQIDNRNVGNGGNAGGGYSSTLTNASSNEGAQTPGGDAEEKIEENKNTNAGGGGNSPTSKKYVSSNTERTNTTTNTQKITGKATTIFSSSYFTVFILIVGTLTLFVIYRKL